MKTRELIRQIKGIFRLPRRKWYFGKIIHGTPYFEPMGFKRNIVQIRKLKFTPQEEIEKEVKMRGAHMRERIKYSNLPIVRRSKYWIKKIFGNYYYIAIGWPIRIGHNELGWKDKYDSPRFEWSPSFYIYFFKWQLICWWIAPKSDRDRYWEMVLWYLHYADKDIKKAKETWRWIDSKTKKSTWDDNYLINPNILK